MRNIKTTLRYVRNSALLLAAVSGLASCSDHEMNGGSGNDDFALETSPLTIFTDPSSMPATVYNYSFGDVKTRAGMPMIDDCPDLPSDLPEYGQNSCETGGVYVISNDSQAGFNNVGETIYVTGKWSIPGAYGDNSKESTIYVMPGGTLEFTNSGFEMSYAGKLKIYNYGTLAFNGGDNQCRIGGDITLLSKATIDQIPNLNLACETVCEGAIKVKKVHFNNSAETWIKCKIEAEEEIIFDNESVFHVGYIKTPKIEIKADASVVLNDGGYIDTDFLDVKNVQTTQIYAEAGDVAVIKTKELQVNNAGGDNLKNTFGNINIICPLSGWIYGENVATDEESLGLNASVKINTEVDVKYVEDKDPNSCAPIFVVPPTTEVPDVPGPGPTTPTDPEKPSLETIASVVNNHNHPISATCIQFQGDKAYVSWHERGEGIQGCIEIVQVKPEGVELVAYAEDPNTDYNHILIDGERLLTVGHNRKSAIVGEIKLAGGLFSTGNDNISYTNLKGARNPGQDNPTFYGGDGNCIVKNGDYYSVATYGGLITLNSDLSRYNDGLDCSLRTDGSAKYVSIVGDKMLTFNLTERVQGAASSPAELRLFGKTDYSWSNPTTVSTNLTVSPVDGKNVAVLDKQGNMYVALGHEGIRKFNSSNVLAGEYKENTVPANGLAVDDTYLYVAFGKGLYIFDKNDLSKPVLTYKHGKPSPYPGNPNSVDASCNYVAVDGDLIYLAYGRDGVDVIRMKKPSK